MTRGPGLSGFVPGEKHSASLPSLAFVKALTQFKPTTVHMFDDVMFNFFCACLVCWCLEVPSVWSHHSRIDLYVEYLPYPMGIVLPRVIRAWFNVLFPLTDGNLLVDPSQMQEYWFDGAKLGSFWNSGCDLERFNPKWYDDGMHV